MTEHLHRSFFEGELPELQAAFEREAGAGKISTDLILKGGGTVKLEGQPTCTDTYITFDRKSGAHTTRTVLLYSAILGVNFSAENQKKVGFHG